MVETDTESFRFIYILVPCRHVEVSFPLLRETEIAEGKGSIECSDHYSLHVY